MSYSRRKIQEVAYRLYSRYQHLFVDNVEGNWATISVLDDIPLEWVKIWEKDSENLGPGESLADIQEENRILHLGFAIELGESWADEELNEERRRRVVEKELGIGEKRERYRRCFGEKKGIYRKTRKVIVGTRQQRSQKTGKKQRGNPHTHSNQGTMMRIGIRKQMSIGKE